MHTRSRAGGLVLWALVPWSMGAHGLSDKHTTISPGWDVIFAPAPLHRRDESECPQNYSLCPASLGGDCCPSDRSCGTGSCYATTAAPQSACSSAGYVACGMEQGGGCCPEGYSCASDGCLLVSGSSSETCSTGSYFCPGGLGSGCCRSGLACGNGYCYATTYPTVSIIREIITTDSNLNVITVTTVVATAYVPSAVPTLQPTAVVSSAISRFTPTETAVAKVAATSTPSSGGLGKGALAGIICAAVVILIAIVVASFFIIRRLNAVAEQSKGSQTAKSGSNRSSNNPRNDPPSGPPGNFGSTPLSSQSPNMSINPLLPISPDPGSLAPPRPSPMHSISDPQELPVSPPLPAAQYGWPLANPLQSHPHQPTSTVATAAAAADTQYFDTRHHSHADSEQYLNSQPSRQTSEQYLDTMRRHSRQNSEDFFTPYPAIAWDAAQQHQQRSPSSDLRDQNLRFGHPRPSLQSARDSHEHGRHWSAASSVPSTQLYPDPAVVAEMAAYRDGGGGAEFGPPTSAAAAAAPPPPPGPACTATAAHPASDRRDSAPSPGRRSRGWSFDFMGAQRRRRRSGGSGAGTPVGSSVGEGGGRLEGVVEGEGGPLQFPNQTERNSLVGVNSLGGVADVPVVAPVEKE